MNQVAGSLGLGDEVRNSYDSTQFELYGPGVAVGPGYGKPRARDRDCGHPDHVPPGRTSRPGGVGAVLDPQSGHMWHVPAPGGGWQRRRQRLAAASRHRQRRRPDQCPTGQLGQPRRCPGHERRTDRGADPDLVPAGHRRRGVPDAPRVRPAGARQRDDAQLRHGRQHPSPLLRPVGRLRLDRADRRDGWDALGQQRVEPGNRGHAHPRWGRPRQPGGGMVASRELPQLHQPVHPGGPGRCGRLLWPAPDPRPRRGQVRRRDRRHPGRHADLYGHHLQPRQRPHGRGRPPGRAHRSAARGHYLRVVWLRGTDHRDVLRGRRNGDRNPVRLDERGDERPGPGHASRSTRTRPAP